jgi:general secretion pathway protein K
MSEEGRTRGGRLPRRGPLRARDRRRGVALLLVLWVFITLGVLALDFASYMRDDAMAAVNFSEETRGYYVALAGMNKALLDAMMERDEFQEPAPIAGTVDEEEDEERQAVSVDGNWHPGEFAGAKYEIRMTDQGGLIPINRASETLLRRLVTSLATGGDFTQSLDRRTDAAVSELVDAIIDWRDPDDLERPHGAESDYYLDRFGYGAKDGFFDAPEELLKVRGVDSHLFFGDDFQPGLRDLVTVHVKDSDQISVNTMPDKLIKVLLGLDAEGMEELAELRASEVFVEELTARLASADPGLQGVLRESPPTIVLVEARADVGQQRNRSTVAAVMNLASDEFDGPDVIRWLDRAPWDGRLPTGSAGGELVPEEGE